MKPIVFLFGLVITCSLGSAQNIEFGIKAGPSYSQYDLGGGKSDYLLGFHGGFYGRFKFNRWLSTQPELLFAQKGGSFDFINFNNEKDKFKTTFSYITIPLMLVFTPTPNIDIHFGPEFGFLTKAKSRSESAPVFEATEYYNDFDKSLAFGGGYRFKNGMRVSARYIVGFKGITDVTITDNLGNPIRTESAGQHYSFQLSLQYNLLQHFKTK